MKIERRYTHEFETRATGDDRAPMLRGHAAVFNSVADLGSFKEIIEPGAFKRTIADDGESIVALWNHNPDFPLARMGYGLSLSEDETGLACEITPDLETTMGRDVSRYVANKSVRGMSIGFTVPADGQRVERRNGELYRVITQVSLLDVSPVTYPAYTSTDISLRSTSDILDELQHLPVPEEELPAEPEDPEPDWEARLAVYKRRLNLVQ